MDSPNEAIAGARGGLWLRQRQLATHALGTAATAVQEVDWYDIREDSELRLLCTRRLSSSYQTAAPHPQEKDSTAGPAVSPPGEGGQVGQRGPQEQQARQAASAPEGNCSGVGQESAMKEEEQSGTGQAAARRITGILLNTASDSPSTQSGSWAGAGAGAGAKLFAAAGQLVSKLLGSSGRHWIAIRPFADVSW